MQNAFDVAVECWTWRKAIILSVFQTFSQAVSLKGHKVAVAQQREVGELPV